MQQEKKEHVKGQQGNAHVPIWNRGGMAEGLAVHSRWGGGCICENPPLFLLAEINCRVQPNSSGKWGIYCKDS